MKINIEVIPCIFITCIIHSRTSHNNALVMRINATGIISKVNGVRAVSVTFGSGKLHGQIVKNRKYRALKI